MPFESPEERTVEVLSLPPGVDEELLALYFENKRRSGGGPLASVVRKDDGAVLVFEESDAAARVLSKGQHVLHNMELAVRKPVPKDQHRLLLQGLNPETSTELIELYVENMIGVNATDYTLNPSLGSGFILIQFCQPISKDFQNLSARISKRPLNGAKVTLEQIEQTDSVLVENLHPDTASDLLLLYFESTKGGSQKVKEVTMLSESTAKVSFVSHASVDLVLDHSHKLLGSDLVVTPYFDFLQPTLSLTRQDSGGGSQDMFEKNSEDLSNMRTTPTKVVNADSRSSFQAAIAAHEAAEEVVEDQTEDEDSESGHIAMADPVKLALLQCSNFLQETEKAHPNVKTLIKDNAVHITGPDRQTSKQIKQSIKEYLGKMAQTNFTLEPEKAEFLMRKDVKERLQQTMNQTGTPALYTVSDSSINVTALTQSSANLACSFLKSQVGHISIPVDTQYECMFYCREWSEFLQALEFSSVSVSERGGNIDVWTLKGMESEKQTAILEFLTTPIERDSVITMEPGMLKYIQTHCHQLLADMDQVSILPLDVDDVCGLKIHGHAVACQMAEEVLQGVVSSICTKTITVNVPGITRYLGVEECQKILKAMETKFQVYILIQQEPWEPLPQQDIFETAWTLMSNTNFQKSSVVDSAQQINSDSVQTNHYGAASRGLLDEAKTIVSAIDDTLEEDVSNSAQLHDFDKLDLYSAEEVTNRTDQSSSGAENMASGLLPVNDGGLGHSSNLEEEAQLSLAIQYSMDSSNWTLQDEEEQLQKALELSKSMMQHKGSNRPPQLKQGIDISLQTAIKAANTIQLVVFALYNSDLIRVDIAFKKKVGQAQVEEKLEHRTLTNMSEYHRRCLEMIKRKHGVEIQIQGTIITVSGFQDFVTGALSDVKLLLDKMSNFVSDQDLLRAVQWVYHDPVSANLIPYSPDATVFIENVWKVKLKKIDILLDNQPHTINFETMQECNLASGKICQISRKLVKLVDLNDDKEEEFSLLSNLPEASRMDEQSEEFQRVVKKFYETIHEYHSKIKIIQVEKLMNQLLYNQYKLKKASILQHATNQEVERTLYHGTSEASVKEICVHGFNRSFCGKNATVYGQGVYFAVNSAYSVKDQYSPPNAAGYKFIFVSKVLTGDYTKGCHSMKTTPLKETGEIPLRYDSVTDDITKPSMFVIFHDTQAFPEYLITCQRIHR